jgi:CheY-like chemotaxis protein
MTNQVSGRPIEILLVEDTAADVRLTLEVLKDGRVNNSVSVARDGVEAMAFLRKQGDYANAPHPDIILLDLNLPRKDGREILAELKEDPDLRRIPVVVLTVSKAEEDILKSYNLHANCYITKPVDLDQFIAAVRSIEHFWLTIVTLPTDGQR